MSRHFARFGHIAREVSVLPTLRTSPCAPVERPDACKSLSRKPPTAAGERGFAVRTLRFAAVTEPLLGHELRQPEDAADLVDGDVEREAGPVAVPHAFPAGNSSPSSVYAGGT